MVLQVISIAFTIFVSMALIGYIVGFFLFVTGPMKFSDLRPLLGLFFACTIMLYEIIPRLIGKCPPFTESLFSLSGHYIISAVILSVCLFALSLFSRSLVYIYLWVAECFPIFTKKHILIAHRENKEGEHNDIFYSGRIAGWRNCLSICGAES